ncbi:S8 family serine peptidase [Allorhizocola rhizosphaerae]|uniref:S8 family serine peptidase n=1 Tax=Allorhizocola rhizosphaerae TaxID=1872709 RepID=UPI001FE9D403|nr:S8 family serine peptidase [Allorhizocola rhizosphaerae]
MTDPTWYQSPRSPSHTGAIVSAVFLGIWLVFLAVAGQATGWFAAQIMMAVGVEMPALVWPIGGLVLAIFAGVPSVLLATLTKHTPSRSAGRAWAIGSGLLAAGTALRALPGTQNVWFLAAFTVIVAIAAFVLRRGPWGFSGWGVVAGLLALAPFLWVGGLGGWLETFFALTASAGLGLLAASTVDDGFWAVYDRSKAQRVVVGGLVAGVALTLLAAAAGGNGAQVLLILVLPPLAFAAAALRRAWPMIGVAAFGPLGFVDPVEVNLFLLENEITYWAALAAGASLVIGLLVGVVYLLPLNPRAGVAAAIVATLGAGTLYAVGGQPGFYGDQLFVVMKEQASLAGLPTTTGVGAGRDARVTAVYQQLVEHANRTQKDLRGELDRFRLRYRPYYLVNGIMVTGGPETRAWLALRDDVDRVLLDQRLRPLPRPIPASRGDVTAPPDRPQWNVQMVGATQAWDQGHTGRGIVVGGSDSGADLEHPALRGNFRGGDDSWFDAWNNSRTPSDRNGHGTHTLATAVGRQNVGVAPDAQWIACANLDRGLGSPSLYLDCLQFMLAPFPHGGDPFTDGRPARAPHVLTNSWGCPPVEGCDYETMRPATDALAAAGIAFVAAAGNEGDRCGSINDPPAPDPAAFTVAAVNEAGQVAPFSSRGQPASGKPDISAPGDEVLSAMPGGTYARQSGTSMATPHVAGVIALLWSARPALVGDLDATYRLLEDTAEPVVGTPTCGDDEDAGAGIVNAMAAIG